jgi:hypothetical protein
MHNNEHFPKGKEQTRIINTRKTTVSIWLHIYVRCSLLWIGRHEHVVQVYYKGVAVCSEELDFVHEFRFLCLILEQKRLGSISNNIIRVF